MDVFGTPIGWEGSLDYNTLPVVLSCGCLGDSHRTQDYQRFLWESLGWNIGKGLMPEITVMGSHGIPRKMWDYGTSFTGHGQMMANLDITHGCFVQ